MPVLLATLPGWGAILPRVRDTPLPDERGTGGTPDADEIIARMRDDEESDWPHRLAADIARAPATRNQWRSDEHPLTEAECLTLRCFASGLNRRMTAELLDVSQETVKTRLVHAARTLGAKNTTHAVALALRAGLIV